jgi:chitinase
MSTTNRKNNSIVNSTVQSRAARWSTLLLVAGALSYAQAATPVVVGYYMQSPTFPVSTLVTNGSVAKLTHLNYAFGAIQLNSTTNQYSCALANPSVEEGASGVFQQLKALKTANPNLKVMISVGGAAGSGYFSAAANATNLDSFAQSCVNTFIDGEYASPNATGIFDGIDIDWEFPKTAGDVAEYTSLMKSLRTKLTTYQTNHPGTPHLLLTSAISPNNGSDWQLQDINFSSTGATQYVDFFNVMTYDNSGTWNTATASTGPLSWIESVMPGLMSQGIPASKIVIGVPFYGIQYTGKFTGDTTSTGLSTLLTQSAISPVQTVVAPIGTLDTDYSSIVTGTLTEPNGTNNLAVSVAHDADGTAWAFDTAHSLLWAYDDATTLQQKGAWVRSQSMAGMMTWEIGKDTAAGTLLCALEGAANGITGTVCTPAKPAPPLFDFESGVSGWMVTGQVYSILDSSAYAYSGHYSMAVNFNSAHWPTSAGTVWVAPPAAVKAGSTVSFEVDVPSSYLANLKDIQVFFMDAKWTWTSTTVSAANLKPNAWNKLSVTVPANAVAPFTEIGLQFDAAKAWSGTIYVDAVTVQ